MSDTIRAGVALSLKDGFSLGIKKAGSEAEGFGSKVTGAMGKVDSALSGVAGKLGALGVTFGAAAAVNNTINFADKMTRLGITAGIGADQVEALKQKMWETAQAPDIKMNVDSLGEAMDQVLERTGDIKFAEENMRAMGLAMQATGASGADIGGLFAEFQKMGLGADEAMKSLDLLTVQGKQGAFTLQNLAGLGPRTIAAYTATGRSGAAALQEMGAALQVIRMGTGSSEQAATAFEALMRNLTDPTKQKALASLGVTVRDQAGNFKSVTSIMDEIVRKSGGSTERLGTIFDAEAMRSFNYELAEFQKTGALGTLDKFNNLQSDGTTIMNDAATGASTLKSNLNNLQTAFYRFGDTKLTGPLEKITNELNTLAEDPEKFQRVFTGIAVGIGAIAAVKGLATVTSLIANFKNLKGGKVGLDVAGAGGAGLPVFVTNMGGGAGVSAGTFANSAPEVWKDTGNVLKSKPVISDKVTAGLTNMTKSAGGMAGLSAITAAAIEVPTAALGIYDTVKNKDLSRSQKYNEVGRISGGAVGGIGGAAAGAAMGAAIGSVVPVLGTLAGGAIGGALGYFLLKSAGTELGGMVGTSLENSKSKKEASEVRQNEMRLQTLSARTGVTPEDLARVDAASRQYAAANLGSPMATQTKPQAVLTGNAEMTVRIEADVPVRASVTNTRSSIPGMNVNTGNVREARANQ